LAILLIQSQKLPLVVYTLENKYCIAFYNLENFFDTKDDPHALDDGFTPGGIHAWNGERMRNKANKLGRAIAAIGQGEVIRPPVLVGLAEVENHMVIEALLGTDSLKGIDYGYVHFNSPDERGIDTALLYHRGHFELLGAESLPLLVENDDGDRDFTRDILYVQGRLNGQEVHIFVNHWPSRREDQDTDHKRVLAAKVILMKLERLPGDAPPCLVMGDFNDGPASLSIQVLMDSGRFINPMAALASPRAGSAKYRGQWLLFDQILFSPGFLGTGTGGHRFVKAGIFAPKFLQEWKGPYKGQPFRTFAGPKYLGGYSDHFPVYLVLEKWD